MKKIILIIIGILIMVWVGLIGFDYYRATKGEKPLIVLKEKTLDYGDEGKVMIYTGLGYKYIKYSLTGKQGYEFGGFWIKATKE